MGDCCDRHHRHHRKRHHSHKHHSHKHHSHKHHHGHHDHHHRDHGRRNSFPGLFGNGLGGCQSCNGLGFGKL